MQYIARSLSGHGFNWQQPMCSEKPAQAQETNLAGTRHHETVKKETNKAPRWRLLTLDNQAKHRTKRSNSCPCKADQTTDDANRKQGKTLALISHVFQIKSAPNQTHHKARTQIAEKISVQKNFMVRLQISVQTRFDALRFADLPTAGASMCSVGAGNACCTPFRNNNGLN